MAPCPTTAEHGLARDLLDRLGDKWSVVAILNLGEGPLRFGELQRRCEGVSQRVLTYTLRQLERDGLVWRKATPTVPLTVEYGLTPIGEDLLPVLRTFFEWAVRNVEAVTKAREAYDRR